MHQEQQISEGYKQTSIGIIPEDWEEMELGKIGKFFKGKGVPKDKIVKEGFKCLTYGDLYTKYDILIKDVKSHITQETAEISQQIEFGDICIAGSGETIEDIGKCATFVADEIGYAGGDIIVFRSDNNAVTLSYIINSDTAKRQKYKFGQGHSVVHIYSSQLEKLKIPLPPLPEQQKIAEILSAWDKTIETCQKTIEELRLRNKGLAQQLLSGKINNKNEEDQLKDYHIIGKYVKEVSKRNTALQEKRILSVTNSRGFINQSEQFGRELASADLSNYKIVKKGQFAYNPSRVNVGSLDMLRTFDAGVLSPMYVVFEVTSKDLIPEFLYYHLKTYWFIGHIPMFVQGSVRDTLSFDGFSGMKFYIPTLEEQKKIVTILDAAASELKHYEEKLNNLKLQKKGLMQQLLTGKVRVRI